ncbi:MAG: S9 family peptidase [Planctomycetes bacterium]|nr:S9 family peptidase [Planctomycetota bacterium]
MSLSLLPLLALVPAVSVSAQDKHRFSIEDMLAMQRISDPQPSPDGKWILATVRTTDVAANRGRNDVWLFASDGSSARPLTTHPESDSSARWLPDGKSLLFLSTRSGSQQIWKLSLEGGEPTQVTKLPLDVDNLVVFPDGKRVACSMEVLVTANEKGSMVLDITAKHLADKDANKVKAMAFDSLPFRHWDTWEDGLRSHVFVMPLEGGEPHDLLGSRDADAPTKPFGGSEEIAVSPDGNTVVLASKIRPGREAMWSTDVDLWAIAVDGHGRPAGALGCMTADNRALDSVPAFSPDGKKLAWLAMARPGFEADRQRIVVVDRATGEKRVLTEEWDRSAQSIEWSPDGRTIYTTADHLGNKGLFAVDVASGKVTPLVEKGSCDAPRAVGDRVFFLHDTLHRPAELMSIRNDGSDLMQVSHLNDARCAAIEWSPYEQFTFQGAHGDTVYGYAMKPSGFAEGSKYPVAMLVHGGPQGSFGDHFHYRWNPMAYAGRGYGVVFIDFHGSTGYGQKFTDAIRGDWGGAPYEDLMKGLDAALAKFPWMNGDRCAALGASYGGYMMNWINGQTDRFKCIVTHASNLDERMAYFDTEELWFPEWEHGGLPWENPEGYTKHNPIDFVKNWKTPTLVIHGARDYRVVDTQGMSVFTALQRKGIPSRMVYFPDENHWILKPQNSQRWHAEVLSWLDRWTQAAR